MCLAVILYMTLFIPGENKGALRPFLFAQGDEESALRFLLYGMPLTGTACATRKFACANFPFGQTASCKGQRPAQ